MYDLHTIHMKINGVEEEVAVTPYATLLDVLRDQLGHIEIKEGCAVGDCGACSVMLDDEPVCTCLVLARQADNTEIITSTGIGTPDALDPIQIAFMDFGATQCGFCTPGLIVAAKSLLNNNPQPSRDDIMMALSGNYCRCTGYEQVIEAVQAAAERMST